MATIRITDDNLLTVVASGSICLVVILAFGGWLLISASFAGGVVIGGALALINFVWLRTALQQVLQMSANVATRSATLRYLVRLSAMGFVLWLLIVQAKVNVFGLLVGLSVLVLSIAMVSLYKLLHMGG
jgi:asparagine N-glycosylation enzyme membrane subunit Stt3